VRCGSADEATAAFRRLTDDTSGPEPAAVTAAVAATAGTADLRSPASAVLRSPSRGPSGTGTGTVVGMGAIKPWHLLCCLLVVVAIIGITAAIAAAGRRR
jgi:hypothetical protein